MTLRDEKVPIGAHEELLSCLIWKWNPIPVALNKPALGASREGLSEKELTWL